MTIPGHESPRDRELPPLGQESPLIEFFHQSSVAASILLLSALAALLCANSALNEFYEAFLHTKLSVMIGHLLLEKTAHHWINDGLMSVFFFLVGLEIKRELLVGELASIRKAILPAVAALGGMVAPAGIYYLFNRGTSAAGGWGIPMATDIAFATGCLALLGGRAPRALGVFLLALAIVDDIGSVAVIAIFYTERLEFTPLLLGVGLFGLSYGLNLLGVRRALPYALIGLSVWLCFLESGVHATMAGVTLAFTIPSQARYESRHFFDRISYLLQRFKDTDTRPESADITEEQQFYVRHIVWECHHVEAPLQRLESKLHPFSMYLIMPIFAFANAGTALPLSSLGELLMKPVTVGILLGLFVGKPLGICGATWLAVKFKLAELPARATWSQVFGMSCLAGIGFTVSLFINGLAFPLSAGGHAEDPGIRVITEDSAAHHYEAAAEAEEGAAGSSPPPVGHHAVMAAHLAEGKAGIFLASGLSALAGLLILHRTCRSEENASPSSP